MDRTPLLTLTKYSKQYEALLCFSNALYEGFYIFHCDTLKACEIQEVRRKGFDKSLEGLLNVYTNFHRLFRNEYIKLVPLLLENFAHSSKNAFCDQQNHPMYSKVVDIQRAQKNIISGNHLAKTISQPHAFISSNHCAQTSPRPSALFHKIQPMLAMFYGLIVNIQKNISIKPTETVTYEVLQNTLGSVQQLFQCFVTRGDQVSYRLYVSQALQSQGNYRLLKQAPTQKRPVTPYEEDEHQNKKPRTDEVSKHSIGFLIS